MCPGALLVWKVGTFFSRNYQNVLTAEKDVSGIQPGCSMQSLQGWEVLYLLKIFYLSLIKIWRSLVLIQPCYTENTLLMTFATVSPTVHKVSPLLFM
jgi:hypothetical protein